MSAIPSKFLLLAVAGSAYGSVQGEIACSVGYREDALVQRYESRGIDSRIDFDRIHSIAFEMNCLASFNHNLYLRGMGLFAKAPGHLKKQQHTAGVEVLFAKGGKAQSSEWLGAVGWQFDFDHGRYTWSLETGWLHSGIKYVYEVDHHLKLDAPFAGTLFHFPLNHRWHLECDFAYIFSSSRTERVEGVDFNKGSFQGPRGGLAIGVDFNAHISFALNWRTFSFFTGHLSQDSIDHERTRWQMQQFSARFSYRF